MSTYAVQAVVKSGNKKTGPLPVTYRDMETCPTDCPFLPTGEIGGCYATGRIFAQAQRGVVQHDAVSLSQVFAKAAAAARYIRDRVSGDIVEDGRIDIGYLIMVADAARRASQARGILGLAKLTAYGYTHAFRLMSAEDVAEIKASGYVLNASCETEQDVAEALALGLPATIATDLVKHGDMVAGRRVVQCPATSHEGVSCATCGLCAKDYEDRPVILFPLHGMAVRKASQAVAARVAAQA